MSNFKIYDQEYDLYYQIIFIRNSEILFNLLNQIYVFNKEMEIVYRTAKKYSLIQEAPSEKKIKI